MSFAGTPLGQNRRLDHNTFLGKQPANPNRPPSPHRAPPTSYAYGAPALGSRSPPKPTSPGRERRTGINDDDDDNQPALARFASLRQRELAASATTTTSKLSPSKWSVKDTSVNIASAFSQAVQDTMAPTYTNPNNSWASGSTQPHIVPRSTSVEYEESVRNANRRLGPAPKRVRESASNLSVASATGRRPIPKTSSTHLVPDSEADDDSSRDIGRAKSPMATVVDAATNLAKGAMETLSRVEFSLREPSFNAGKGDESFIAANGSAREESYDYMAEEQMFNSLKEKEKAKEKEKTKQAHKRGRISVDNKAYKPSEDSEFEDDDIIEKEKRGKRRKARKELKGLELPSITPDKGKKRRRSTKKTAAGGGPEIEGEEGEEEEGSEEEEEGDDEQSQSQIDPSASSSSHQRGGSVPRGRSLHRDQNASFENTAGSETQILDSIPEVDESQIEPMDIDSASGLSAQKQAEQKHSKKRRSRSRSRTRAARYSVGGMLGTAVNKTLSGAMSLLMIAMFAVGQFMGTIYALMVNRPAKWLGGSDGGGRKAVKYVVLGGAVLVAWTALRLVAGDVPGLSVPFGSISIPMPTWWRTNKRYTAPETPIENIAELVERLSKIELALSGLVGDTERVASKAEDGVKGYREVLDKIGSLEGKVRSVGEVGGEVRGVKREVEVLQAQIRVRERDEKDKEREREAAERKAEKERKDREDDWRREMERIEREVTRSGGKSGGVVDDAKIRMLEEKFGSVESGIREAIEVGKRAAASASAAAVVASSASSVASSAVAVASSASSSPSSAPGAAWWNKLGSSVSSKSGLTIKSADGQDVTALISHLVNSAVSMLSQDGIAKPDYALHSGGARVVPHLTSPTMELRPSSAISSIFGLLTGNGYAVGRPPVTALHHEMHSGHCWPFVGEQGQLGVALSMPVVIDEITVDHVAKEVAFDMRSAPKEMEVWGLVEGRDNLEKVQRWREVKAEKMKAETIVPTEDGPVEIDSDDETAPVELEGDYIFPTTLPKHAPYIRIANFTYDINAPGNTQTFPVDPEIRALGVDFGVVALRVLSNWGKEFTCLYRFRVHGSRAGDVPLPTPGLEETVPSDEESA